MAKAKKKRLSTAFEEIQGIIPCYFVMAAALLFISAVVSVTLRTFDYRLYTGAVLGCMVSFGNFYFLCVSAESIARGGADKSKARFRANAAFGLRYIGTFVVLSVILILDIAHFVTLVIPLFAPKFYYTYIYVIKNSKKQ